MRRLRLRAPRPPGGQMTVIEHLAELRYRLIVSVVAIAFTSIICFILSPRIISFFVSYYSEATNGTRNSLIFTGPLDAFVTRLKIATYGGVVLAVPVWLYQLWRFITPALDPKEKRYAIPFVLSSIVLFGLGAFVALQTLPKALEFLLGVGGPDLQPLLTADKYIGLVSLMILAFGIAFEFPIVLMFLLLARAVTTKQLRKWRRPAVVIIVVFAAVITPSQDPYSLAFMAIPMYIFYEASILLGRILKR